MYGFFVIITCRIAVERDGSNRIYFTIQYPQERWVHRHYKQPQKKAYLPGRAVRVPSKRC